MSDMDPEPFDPSDARIARAMRSYTERAVVPVVASDLARAAMATVRPGTRAWPLAITGPSRLAWAAAIVALLTLALAGGLMVTGAPTPSPVHLGVVQPSPSATPAAPARLVFVNDNAIYVGAADGSGATRVASAAVDTSGVIEIRWSPAGRRFALLTNQNLVVFADDGRTLASYPFTSWMDQQFAWSPDGSQIAMLHRHGPLEILSLDGTPTRTLPLPDDFGFTYDLPGIAWSPDGKTIALAGCTGCAPKTVNNQLWLDKADGSGLTNLIDTPFHYTPSWGPDGQELYFGLAASYSDPGGLAVIKPDGSGFRQLYSRNAWLGLIAPSPDGSRILLRANPSLAITINADGSQPVIASGQQASNTLRWSPDGRLLTMNGSGVVEFDADGRNPRILVPGAVAFDIGGSH